jgi:AcrR family transcriptional regulator
MDKKGKIYECAKELFAQNGFKETNVADITNRAGMATGTFYNYYPSKDKLFMEIYLDENAKLKKKILSEINPDGDPAYVMKQMLSLNYLGMSANPILREWYNRDVFAKIERNFREADGLASVEFMYGSFITVVQQWQDQGKMRRDIGPEMIMAIFTALAGIDTRKEEVGVEYFPELMEHMAEFVMKGLTEP